MGGKPKQFSTPEEYEKDKQIILSAYRAGLPGRRMEAKFGYSRTYIKRLKAAIIEEGLITEDEIKTASAQYYKENPNAQGLNKTKVRKKKEIKGRSQKTLEKREQIFKLVKQKLSKTQIAREIGLSETGVSWHIKELIKAGRLAEDEVVKENSQSGRRIDKSSPEYIAKRKEIVEFLQKGYKYNFIRKELDITPLDLEVYITDIRENNIMTLKQIEEARERKRQEDLQFVEKAVNDGLSITQIRELKPEFAANEVTPMIKELISKGIITQEQVDENRKNGNRRTINKDVKMSPDEQIEFIFEKVKKGYSPEEIVKSDKTKSLSMHKVLYQKRQLIAKGRITQEEADIAMRERQKKTIKRKRKRVMKKMKEYAELGYTIQEMAEFIKEYSRSELSEIKSEYIDELGWYTKEELEEFVRLRKQREYDSLPEEEKRRLEEEKLAEEKRQAEEKAKRQEEAIARRKAKKAETRSKRGERVEELKEHLKSGKTIQRAAEFMKISWELAYKIRRESIEDGTWLTEEELKEIEKKKKQKQARQRKRREKKKQEEQLAKRKAKEEEKKKRHEADAENLKPYIKEGKTRAEAARLSGLEYQYASNIIKEGIQNGTWLTEEELREIETREQEKLEQTRKAKEEARKKKQEEQREAREKKKAEERRKKEEEALAKRKAREEENKRKQEEALAQRRAKEEERKKKQEEILAQKKEKEETKKKQRRANIETLKSHIKAGKSKAEAARISGLNYQYACTIIKEAIQNGTWLTEEELKEIEKRKNKNKKDKEKKREKQKLEEQKRKKEEEQLRIRKEILEMREYVEQGYTTIDELAKKMNYGTPHIRQLRKLAIEANIWFSEEAIQEFRRIRKRREELEAKKAQEAEQKRLEEERKEAEKARKEAEEARKALEKDRKRKIRGYAEEYKKYRREAKKEDNLELDGEENVSTEGRKKFIEVLTKIHNADAELPAKDIGIVLNAFYMHPEMADVKGIKALIGDATKKGGIGAAQRMIIELADCLRQTKFYGPLVEYGRWMKKYALRPKIQELKEQGMDNTTIGERLGISSAEVSIIFHNDKKPEFSDPGNR